MFLNRTQEKYDVIFGDAFSSYYSIPYQLTTRQVAQRSYDILNDNGIVILNLISAIDGPKGEFLRAEYQTYKSIFPQVYVFPVQKVADGNEFQNVMIIALKNDKPAILKSLDEELNQYLSNVWKKEIANDMPILTDDYAPVDNYLYKSI